MCGMKEKIENLNNSSAQDTDICFRQITEEFNTTDNAGRRNDLALLLSDYNRHSSVKTIVEMIKKLKSQQNQKSYVGTLLYALSNLQYGEHLDYIFTLVFDNSFEVSREAYCLLENFDDKNKISEIIKNNMPAIIDKIYESQEQANFYTSLLEFM